MCVAGSRSSVSCECPRGDFDKTSLYWDGIIAELQVFQDGRLFALAGDMFHSVTVVLVSVVVSEVLILLSQVMGTVGSVALVASVEEKYLDNI